MKKSLVAVAAVFSLGFGLACSGLPTSVGGLGGGSFDNVGACKRYVEAYNSAECLPVDLDANDLCVDALNITPCDLSSYYDCMAAAVKCKDGLPDIAGQVDCKMPTCQ